MEIQLAIIGFSNHTARCPGYHHAMIKEPATRNTIGKLHHAESPERCLETAAAGIYNDERWFLQTVIIRRYFFLPILQHLQAQDFILVNHFRVYGIFYTLKIVGCRMTVINTIGLAAIINEVEFNKQVNRDE